MREESEIDVYLMSNDDMTKLIRQTYVHSRRLVVIVEWPSILCEIMEIFDGNN